MKRTVKKTQLLLLCLSFMLIFIGCSSVSKNDNSNDSSMVASKGKKEFINNTNEKVIEENTETTTEAATEQTTEPITEAVTAGLTEVAKQEVKAEQEIAPPSVNITDVSEILYVKTALNVRSGYGTNHPVIGNLAYGNKTTRTGICDNGWSRIIYNNKEAYVSSTFLQAQEIVISVRSSVPPAQSSAPVQNKAPVNCHPMLMTEGNADPGLLATAQQELNKVSGNIVSFLSRNNWKVIITDKDIASTYYNGAPLGRLAGLTKPAQQVIYLSNTSREIKRALVHELGHAFDTQLYFKSQSPEFQAIYQEEKNTWRDVTGANSSRSNMEYFAECFSQYYTYSSNLSQTAPKTYNYINNLIISH